MSGVLWYHSQKYDVFTWKDGSQFQSSAKNLWNCSKELWCYCSQMWQIMPRKLVAGNQFRSSFWLGKEFWIYYKHIKSPRRYLWGQWFVFLLYDLETQFLCWGKIMYHLSYVNRQDYIATTHFRTPESDYYLPLLTVKSLTEFEGTNLVVQCIWNVLSWIF